MGFFTFTDARSIPRKKKNDFDFFSSDIIHYDSYCRVICPDNTAIIEKSYDGYGLFGGQDIYALCARWNRDYLTDIFRRLDEMAGETKQPWGYRFTDMAKAYQARDDEWLQAEVAKLLSDDPFLNNSLEVERTIGIAIGCLDFHDYVNDISKVPLPYPIKITKLRSAKLRYDDLAPSFATQ